MKRMKVIVLRDPYLRELWRGSFLVATPQGVGLAGASTLTEAMEGARRLWRRFKNS